MDALTHLIANYGPWLWFAAAVALLILETVFPGVHFLWFGVSAALVGALAVSTPLSWQVQLIVWAAVSVASVFLVRRLAPPTAASDEPVLNVRGAQYIGRKVEVVDAIRNGRGKVRVGDTVWSAEGEDAPAGSEVEVTGVSGTVLVVENIERAA